MSDNWYKVDNVAKVFLATYNNRDTRSFRISATLKEDIDPVLLQKAVERAISEIPQFQVMIHKGVFWHYLEETDKIPKVKEENDRPCPTLYGPEMESRLHYSVTYFHKRINLEMFHALTDGNGGLEFLNLIVQNYLQLKYPGTLDHISMKSSAAADDMAQDSFGHFYNKDKESKTIMNKDKPGRAYHIKGRLLPYNQLQFFELHMSASEILKLSKECNVSLTSYLGARLMMAIYRDMPLLQRNKPVTVSMPVNLRNYYPSETIRNFFNSVYVTHVFEGDETLEDLAKVYDKQFKEALSPEKIAIQMNDYQKLERFIFVRLVPLFIKNPVVKMVTKKQIKSVTAIVSNMGKITIPEEIVPFVEGYAGYCSSENMFITITSYGDDLTLGISSPHKDTSVLRRFVKELSDAGVNIRVYATKPIL